MLQSPRWYLSMGETVKPIVHSQHLVPMDQPNPDSRPHGCVHPGGWSPDVHHSQVIPTLQGGEEEMALRKKQEKMGMFPKLPGLLK